MSEIKGRPLGRDTKAQRLSRRITPRTREIILREYEERMALGENREDILENFGERYDRQPRQIERYIERARKCRDEKRQAELESQSARAKHWDDLAAMAKQFDDMWIKHLESGLIITGYIVDVDTAWHEGFTLRCDYRAKQLLTHLKAEFSTEFERIESWRDLLKSPLPTGCLMKLTLVVNRRTFKGTCEICQDWS